MEVFPTVRKIGFEGPESDNPLAFKHYNAKEKVLGKTMSDLPSSPSECRATHIEKLADGQMKANTDADGRKSTLTVHLTSPPGVLMEVTVKIGSSGKILPKFISFVKKIAHWQH